MRVDAQAPGRPQRGADGPAALVASEAQRAAIAEQQAQINDLNRQVEAAQGGPAAGAPPMTEAWAPSTASTCMRSLSRPEKTTKAPPW